MDAAGVLPAFAGIACHDAWAPYDTYSGVAAHALCNAHILRELAAVTETGAGLDKTWSQQAIDALLALKNAAGEARAAGYDAIDPDLLAGQAKYFTDAADAGIALNAARRSDLHKKRHALAARMKNRQADYLRFARDRRVPFDNDLASHCTSWGCCAVFVGVRWLGWLADVILTWGGDIFACSRAAGDAVGVAAA
jgi:transposase